MKDQKSKSRGPHEYESKSRKPSVRIKRATEEAKEAGKYEIGAAIFEQIIEVGVKTVEDDLNRIGPMNHLAVTPQMFREVIEILRKHLEII
jgi:hypothetical protein